MNVTFRQLRLFLALADHGSVSAAARACHITQPTASMHLRDLTANIGLPLYDVIGKKVFLTTAGEELAATARTMVEEWASFEQRIDTLKGVKRGRLKISVVSTAKYFIPRLLGEFCHHYPDIDVALEVLNRDGVLNRLHANKDDLYIMSIPPDDVAIERQVFLPNPLVAIASVHHPLAQQDSVVLEDLAAYRFILREKGSGTRMACEGYFKQQGFFPPQRMEIGSNAGILQAVEAGMGVAVLSRHCLAHSEGLKVLPLQGFPIHSNWYVVRLSRRRPSPVAEAFQNLLLAQQARSL